MPSLTSAKSASVRANATHGSLSAAIQRDALYTVRLWRRNPGVSFASFLALTVGIAGSTTIFGIISALLLQPLPVKDPASLTYLFTSDRGHSQSLVSMPDELDIKRRLHAAEGVAIASEKLFNLSANHKAVLVHALTADAALFTVLGIQPAEGRPFTSVDSQPGHASKVLLSWPFWQAQFAGRPMLGQTVRLDDRLFTIVGILPQRLDLPFAVDLWIPLEFDLSKPENQRYVHGYYAFARLRPGDALPQFRAELSVLSAQLAAEYPLEDKGVSFGAMSFRDWIAGDTETPLFILLVAVAGVLLMACANVANLLLARSSARLREISVRVAVGAGRTDLFRQLMTESLLLASLSATAGLGLAAFALSIVKSLPNTQIPRPESIAIDWRVLLFAAGLACLTTVAFGVLPALNASRQPVTEILKEAGSRTGDSRRKQLLRRFLLASETAIATTLLIVSFLLVQSFLNVTSGAPGFQVDHLLTLFLSLPDSRYGSDSIYAAHFADQVLPLVKAIPGIKQAAITRNLPLHQGGNGPIQIEGRPLPTHLWEAPFVQLEQITPSYRQTLNIPLLRGRDFDQREDAPGATAILINQTAAQRLFPGQDPVGKRLAYRIIRNAPAVDWHEIVGVIGDTRHGPSQSALPAIFIPLYRAASPYLAVIVRTQGNPSGYAHAIEDAVRKVDPDVPSFLVQTMDEVLRQQVGPRTFQTSLLSMFTVAALLLAAAGILSVGAYTVSQRTSEIGLRMACGATQSNIVRMILVQTMAPAILGIFVGVFLALAAGRYLESLLSGVSLQDPAPYAFSALFLLGVAALASLLPARRAAAVDPWTALRYE